MKKKVQGKKSQKFIVNIFRLSSLKMFPGRGDVIKMHNIYIPVNFSPFSPCITFFNSSPSSLLHPRLTTIALIIYTPVVVVSMSSYQLKSNHVQGTQCAGEN